jgi:hypothetical protein
MGSFGIKADQLDIAGRGAIRRSATRDTRATAGEDAIPYGFAKHLNDAGTSGNLALRGAHPALAGIVLAGSGHGDRGEQDSCNCRYERAHLTSIAPGHRRPTLDLTAFQTFG